MVYKVSTEKSEYIGKKSEKWKSSRFAKNEIIEILC